MDTSPAGFRPARLLHLMRAAIRRCDLDLSDTIVFTEAASGAYVVTPLLAAMAGAQRVFALARPSRYGTGEQVAQATRELARLATVSERIEIIFEKQADIVAQADVITNSGHVRPIDAEMVEWMKPIAVIPLMFEAWEFRVADLDLAACRRRSIPVAGTNERHRAVDVLSCVGTMAIRLLLDAGIAVSGSRVAVWCDNPMRPFLMQHLVQAGAVVDTVDRLDDDPELAGVDAILVAMRPRAHPVVGHRAAHAIARRCPQAVVSQFWGDIDRAALARCGVSFWPIDAPAAGHQSILPSRLGPEPVVRLQAGGLKVGQVMAQARAGAASHDAALAAVVASGFGQALPALDASAEES